MRVDAVKARGEWLHARHAPQPQAATCTNVQVMLVPGLGSSGAYSFDLSPGVSLADYLAANGWDVWTAELRGGWPGGAGSRHTVQTVTSFAGATAGLFLHPGRRPMRAQGYPGRWSQARSPVGALADAVASGSRLGWALLPRRERRQRQAQPAGGAVALVDH
jgi:hypothetical protein